MAIKFCEIYLNPYDGTIEAALEKGAPITMQQIFHENTPSIPVAVPPNQPEQPRDYIRKQFCIRADEDISASDLREMLEDRNYMNPGAMPTIKSSVPASKRNKIQGFFGAEETCEAYNQARIANGMEPIEIPNDTGAVKPRRPFTPSR